MDRIIRVTGKGKISIKPDTIRLNISLEDIRETYEETLQQSSVQAELLKDCFIKLGFEGNDLKTLYFNVDTEYESYQDRNKEWKRKFVGYKFTHRFKLDFSLDNERLGKVLYALAHCPIHPEFSIAYTVKDMEQCKNQLLGQAVVDSKQKAEILTQAAGMNLGQVITIDYSWGEMEIISRPMNRIMESCMVMEDCCESSYDMDIEPDDIDVTDTVTVVWSLA
ncbi:MAG: SIMPL domain-containing protein [Lachnospiraceae bacterium]